MSLFSLFITGTGTGVGKTLLTAGLAALLQRAGESFCIYKPIQTGCPDDGQTASDPETVKTLVGEELPTFCSYCFPEPVAPYAADRERTIRPRRLLEDFKRLQGSYKIILVEGAGGVRVPISPHFEMLDLIRMLQLPVVVVAHPGLGTMNHTLLTVDALQAQRLEIKGVVISGSGLPAGLPQEQADPDNPLQSHPDPAAVSLLGTLEPFLPVPVLGVLPDFTLTPGVFHPTQTDILKPFEALSRKLSEAPPDEGKRVETPPRLSLAGPAQHHAHGG
jgi:dethiobiotin synthetase